MSTQKVMNSGVKTMTMITYLVKILNIYVLSEHEKTRMFGLTVLE